MTKQDQITVAHKNIAAALAVAQMQMGKALKQSSNPHFKSKYADLSSVVDACMPALNANGIAVIQPASDESGERFVRTVLIHGDSGETLECRVPVIVQKNDMQGYGSAVTYARRYGLMCMTGIAPEDDDGNAAAKAAPKHDAAPPRTVSPDQYVKLRDLAEEAGVDADTVCAKVGAPSLEQFPADKFAAVAKGLQAKIDAANSEPLDGDKIPNFEGAK